MHGIIALVLLFSAALLMAASGVGPFAKEPFNRYALRISRLPATTQLLIRRVCQLSIALCVLYFLGFIR
ncbi:MAG: hypothetical protein H7A09_07755 [Oceanospirillaceae bacterium]|nr:hypothetical protein [Oceanospirillaceae bacterium]MCP5349733.1 hypothetical protein [Oceanospirillaceae bacterium]